jgi:HK97 family phage major capsid protein
MKNIWIKDDGSFNKLSENEVASLKNVEDLSAYHIAKGSHETAELRKEMEGKVGTEAIKALEEQFGELSRKHVEKLEESVLEQGKEMANLRKSNAIESAPKNFDQELRAVWAKSKDSIANFMTEKGDKFALNLKTEVTRASVADNTMASDVAGLAHIPRRNNAVSDLFNQATLGPDSNGTIRYWQEAAQTDNAAPVAESAVISESAITWEEILLPLRKIGDSMRVTREALEDVSFISAEIRNFSLKNVELQLDEQALLGDGTGQNFSGVDLVAPNYAAGGFAGLFGTAATIYDVISTGIVQIANAGQNSVFVPNAIVMNPTDAELMRLSKDDNDNYIMPTWLSADGMSVKGVRIIESQLVPANQAYIGDFTFGTMWGAGTTTLDVATQHGTDWIEDVQRLKVTVRKQLVIRTAHAGAFLHIPSITAAQTALNA